MRNVFGRGLLFVRAGFVLASTTITCPAESIPHNIQRDLLDVSTTRKRSQETRRFQRNKRVHFHSNRAVDSRERVKSPVSKIVVQ